MVIMNMAYLKSSWGGWWWDMNNWAHAQSVQLSWTFYTGVSMSPNGTKLFASSTQNWYIYQRTLTTPYDLSTMTSQISKQVGSAWQLEDLWFKPDGTKAYALTWSNASPQIKELSLATAWDINSYTQQTYSLSAPKSLRCIYISDDGGNLYCWSSTYDLYHYTMSTPRNLSTLTSDWTFAQTMAWMWFKPDWTMLLYSVGWTNKLNYRTLSTAWDISTLWTAQEVSLHGQDEWWGLWFNNVGTIALWIGWEWNTNYVTKYTL